MAVFRWGQGWQAFHDLEREVDRLLQNVNLTFERIRWGRRYPPINLYEREDEYILTAELPGMRAEDLELTVTGNVLTMRGRRSDLPDVPPERYRRQERPRGAWERTVSIPDRVNTDELSAEFSNGVLTVHFPKEARLKPRQIPVIETGG